jgi:hypothetical protein
MTDSSTVLFGEPEDNGAHLIPLRGISRDRAATLAQTVGREYGMVIDIDTATGQDNRLAVLDAIDASFRLYRAQRRIGISADEARAVHASNMAALEAHLRMTGLTVDEVETLVNKYRDLPPDLI